jgi:hypothetical protein
LINEWPQDWLLPPAPALEKPTQADLNRVKVEAQIQFGIEQYRTGAVDIDKIELEAERHDSAPLATA